jgi:hypothetical protein
MLPVLSRASSTSAVGTTAIGTSAIGTSVVGTRAKVDRGLSYPSALDDDGNHGLEPGEVPKIIDKADTLGVFRTRVGIENAPILTASHLFRRHARNIGLYDRICVAEYKAHWMYTTFSFLINFCLGAQIVIAAALTALGAGNGPHSAVTAFGALNTVIAGFLTYLKGSGLPNRLKYYETEWTRLREYIEQRERDLCTDSIEHDVEAEVFAIERMYEEVCDEIEANTPENFTSVSNASNRRDNRPTRMLKAQQYRDMSKDPYGHNGQLQSGSYMYPSGGGYPPPPTARPGTASRTTGGTVRPRDKDEGIAHAV